MHMNTSVSKQYIILFFILTACGITICNLFHEWRTVISEIENGTPQVKAPILNKQHLQRTLEAFEEMVAILHDVPDYDDIFEHDPEVTCRFPMLDPLNLHHALRYYSKLTARCPDNRDSSFEEFSSELGVQPDNFSVYCTFLDHEYVQSPEHESKPLPVNSSNIQSVLANLECMNENGDVVYSDHFQQDPQPEATLNIPEYNIMDELSVTVIGISSMSRLSFMRQMPHSYNYMKNEIGSFEMLGFTKMGVDYSAFVSKVKMDESKTYDFSSFQKSTKEPMYYRKMFNLKSNSDRRYDNVKPDLNDDQFFSSASHSRQLNHHVGETADAWEERLRIIFCRESRPNYSLQLNYLLTFMRANENKPSFSFSHFDEAMDEDFVEFLKVANMEGLLNKTILILLGDGIHDQRIITSQQTFLSRVEDAMPLVSISLPSTVPDKWKKALAINRKRLTSSNDLFQTFVEALETINVLPKSKLDILRNNNEGASLFSIIATNRTCKEAKIPVKWCMCQEGRI